MHAHTDEQTLPERQRGERNRVPHTVNRLGSYKSHGSVCSKEANANHVNFTCDRQGAAPSNSFSRRLLVAELTRCGCRLELRLCGSRTQSNAYTRARTHPRTEPPTTQTRTRTRTYTQTRIRRYALLHVFKFVNGFQCKYCRNYQ